MKKTSCPVAQIAQAIHFLRGQKVLLDFDLATLYDVPSGELNAGGKTKPQPIPNAISCLD